MQQLKEAEQLGELLRLFESIVDTVRQPLLVMDAEHHVVSANQSFYHAFQLRDADVLGRTVFEIDDGGWNIPKLRELLEERMPEHSLENFQLIHEFPRVGRRVLLLNARRLKRERACQAWFCWRWKMSPKADGENRDRSI